jgi:hypothetical protein
VVLVTKDATVFITPDWKCFKIQLKCPSSPGSAVTDSILTAEYVMDRDPKTNVKTPRLLLTDLIVLNGQVQVEDFAKRQVSIDAYFVQPRKSIPPTELQPIRVRAKLYLSAADGIEKLLKSILPSLPHPYRDVVLVSKASGHLYRYDQHK